ncbi:MAG: neutral zinc metallopeptidase [Gemmatimonadales bacterium]
MQRLSPDPSGLWTIQIELQADCMAGQYTRDAKSRGRVKPEDEEEAFRDLRGSRDYVDNPWFNPYAHGTSGQRINAFQEGLEGRTCEGPDFWNRIHVDTTVANVERNPPRGSLLHAMECSRGWYSRRETRLIADLVRTGANGLVDAVSAKFVALGGSTVEVTRHVYLSPRKAQDHLLAHVKRLKGLVYAVTNQGKLVTGTDSVGTWKKLVGATEIVVQTNHTVFTMFEGPWGAAWEFSELTMTPCSR